MDTVNFENNNLYYFASKCFCMCQIEGYVCTGNKGGRVEVTSLPISTLLRKQASQSGNLFLTMFNITLYNSPCATLTKPQGSSKRMASTKIKFIRH